MIKISVFVCLLGYVLSLPIDEPQLLPLLTPLSRQEVHIVRNERVDNQDGSYRFSYETSDGQTREETAHVVELLDQGPILVVTGSYSYIGPDGVTYKVHYVADDNGFRPQGDHLGTSEPIKKVEPLPYPDDIFPPPLGLPPNAINSLLG